MTDFWVRSFLAGIFGFLYVIYKKVTSILKTPSIPVPHLLTLHYNYLCVRCCDKKISSTSGVLATSSDDSFVIISYAYSKKLAVSAIPESIMLCPTCIIKFSSL